MGEETGEEVKMGGGGGEELGQESGEEVPGADPPGQVRLPQPATVHTQQGL